MEPDPLELAAAALRYRDRSRHEVDDRLRRAGVDDAARADALARLEQVGYVDDDRYAANRAAALADRGYGDAAIRLDLRRNGVDRDRVDDALARVAPEAERAAGAVARFGRTPRTASRLARKGFARETIEAAFETGLDSQAP